MMRLLAVLAVVVQAPMQGGISPDSAEALRDRARDAERAYEFLLRSMAPSRFGSSSSSKCDEVVGRFCLRYEGSGTRRPDPEVPGKVISARQLAVEMLRQAFAVFPHDLSTAGPLLRYLVEDGRAEEALAAARTFSWASGDSVWGPLLEGYALHAAGDDSLAEARFDEGLARVPRDARRRFERVSYLVAPKERKVYDALMDAEQEIYEEALWRLSDPLYLTPGNERRVEHIARHVWSRLLSDAPVVYRMQRWDDDLEQLTVRYGVPSSRERLVNWSAMISETMVEYFDPDQLAYVPETLRTEGFPGAPPPGDPWPLDNERARSGFAARSVRRLVHLDHQTSRFPVGDSVVLRVDGALAFDSAADPRSGVRAALFLLDRDYRHAQRQDGAARISGDTATATFEAVLPAERVVYSLELLEPESRLAGRARYAIDLSEISGPGPLLSDVVVAHPYGDGDLPTGRQDPELRPMTRLVVSPGDTLGLYAEAHRLMPAADDATHYAVRLRMRRATEPALLARAFGWIGRKLGLAEEREVPSLEFEGEGVAGHPAILAVDLPLGDLETGLYAIELTVIDLIADRSRTMTRLVRVGEPES
jgi:hypothetical protein